MYDEKRISYCINLTVYLKYGILFLVRKVVIIIDKILKGYSLRIYPTKKQQGLITRTFGCTRFVWNKMLDMQISRYENNKNSKYQNSISMKNLLKSLKQEYLWLKEADGISLQASCENLDQSYQRFFKHIAKYPRFKYRKHYTQSYTTKFNNNNIELLDNHHIKLPKLHAVYFRSGRLPQGKIKRATIRINSQGQYYCSVLCEQDKSDNQTLPKTHENVGIDLGLTDLAILSNGIKYPKSTYDRDLKANLRIWERKMSHRQRNALKEIAFDKHEKVLYPRELKDFPRYQQARKVVAKYKAKIANRRKDRLQKLTTSIVKDYDIIIVEDLKSSNMLKNHSLAKSISNASWYEFVRELEYKCNWYGKQLIKVSPQNTSRRCSNCGMLNKKFSKLSQNEWMAVRHWKCPNCGTHLDRDVNASVNILNKGLEKLA